MTATENKLYELVSAVDVESSNARIAAGQKDYMQLAQDLLADTIRQQKFARKASAHKQNLAIKIALFHTELFSALPSLHGVKQVQYPLAASRCSLLYCGH